MPDIETRPTQYPGYSAGTDGHIYRNGVRLKGVVNKRNGRCQVSIYIDGNNYLRTRNSGAELCCRKPKTMAVRNLIAACFLPPSPSPKHHLVNKNGDRSDNRPENLGWSLPERKPPVCRSKAEILDPVSGSTIRFLLRDAKFPRGKIAEIFGIRVKHVYDIKTRGFWSKGASEEQLVEAEKAAAAIIAEHYAGR